MQSGDLGFAILGDDGKWVAHPALPLVANDDLGINTQLDDGKTAAFHVEGMAATDDLGFQGYLDDGKVAALKGVVGSPFCDDCETDCDDGVSTIAVVISGMVSTEPICASVNGVYTLARIGVCEWFGIRDNHGVSVQCATETTCNSPDEPGPQTGWRVSVGGFLSFLECTICNQGSPSDPTPQCALDCSNGKYPTGTVNAVGFCDLDPQVLTVTLS